MTVHIALLKGVNVGGNNKLPMAPAREKLSSAGLTGIVSYIQSGNFLWPAKHPIEAETEIFAKVLKTEFCIAVDVLVMSLDRLQASAKNCPLNPDDPKTLHFYFPTVAWDDDVDLARLRDLLAGEEEIVAGDGVLYHHTPQGFSKSKLAAKIPRLLPGPVTARNLNSIRKIVTLGESLL